MTSEPPNKIRILMDLIAVVVLWGGLQVKGVRETPLNVSDSPYYLIQGNSIKALSIPNYFKPQIYSTLIDCLSFYESTNNSNAVGRSGECGILQFMPSTFQFFCVDRYLFRDDIWDVEIQRRCAEMMIGDGYLHHWTTSPMCI